MDRTKTGEKKAVTAATLFSAAFLCALAGQLSVPVISDETVTMANAAWVTGRDWSLMIAHLGGPYYRFIQALMTVPLFAFLDDPDMIYRISMVLQALVHATTVPVVYLICRRHLRISSPVLAALLGMAVCFIPSIALYVFYYRGDYLLCVLPWYVLLFLLETVRTAEEGKKGRRILFSALAVICCALAYMAHTRGIVLILALVFCAGLIWILTRKKSLSWPVSIGLTAVLILVDQRVSGILKQALYSISGVNSNAFESTDMGGYLNIFSVQALKDLLMLCLSWLNTLVVTTQGLVLIGGAAVIVFCRKVSKRQPEKSYPVRTEEKQSDILPPETSVIRTEEKIMALFTFLVFAGYYAVGALYFKGTYVSLATGELTRRSDRLLYDRYSVCGAGMLVFFALYVLCCHREWLSGKLRIACMAAAAALFALFLWKFLPIVVKYPGYVYNTITLNTFQVVSKPAKLLSGMKYGRTALIAACLLGLGLMAAVLLVSLFWKKRMPYMLLALVLASDLALILVNYGKIRKASDDYVQEATQEVTEFLQEMEEEITEEFPYVLKGGLSGVKIQFYQSQLMEYQLFGKKQEESLGITDYFIISKKGDIDLTWYEEDYYLFEEFDYENAEYDIVYVKGDALAKRLEELGYTMIRYVPEIQE
ncbi:MAG: hypothetical protein LUD16_01745 [Lachnospiraceae bacterium]|nr:hypothetical protein [Lachnospiraceae bacterium]